METIVIIIMEMTTIGYMRQGVLMRLDQDVYAWAGKDRTVRLSKGGSTFCYPEHIGVGDEARVRLVEAAWCNRSAWRPHRMRK